jgi:DNA-directed RNA polymerase subunit RPC12/RpoP
MPKPRYRLPTKVDFWKSAIYLLVFVVVISVGAWWLIENFGTWGMVIWFVIFVGGGILVLVRWHAGSTAYLCPKCEHEFEISALQDLVTPHKMDKYYLRCPSCRERSWMQVLVKEEPTESQ